MNQLTKREYMFSREGPTFGVNRKPIAYEIFGLPSGQEAWIADINYSWQILRAIDGVYGDWSGEYRTVDDALAALSLELCLEHAPELAQEVVNPWGRVASTGKCR